MDHFFEGLFFAFARYFLLVEGTSFCKFVTCLFFCKFTDIRTFEVLVRSYEIREQHFAKRVPEEDGSPVGPLPQKRKQSALTATKSEKTESNISVMAKPCNTARGHTGYLTFGRLTVL